MLRNEKRDINVTHRTNITAICIALALLGGCSGTPEVETKVEPVFETADVPYAREAQSAEPPKAPITKLAETIARDGEAAEKYTAKSLMFFVPPGGYQQAVLKLAHSFGYQQVFFEGDLDGPKYNCYINKGFWLKGNNFMELASKVLSPYGVRMTVHAPDRIVAVKRAIKGNPCEYSGA